MKIRVYNDSVHISGYVNVAERISKRIREQGQEFYEKVKEGAFGDAIRRNNNIKLLFNHDSNRELASSANDLDIYEDNIGLFASATITDPEVVEKAKSRSLSGWSFGFSPLKESKIENYGDLPLRCIESLNLYEVSILDDKHIPAYNSMSLEVRGMGTEALEVVSEKNIVVEELENVETRETFDNSIFIAKINDFLKERNLQNEKI